MRAAASFGFQVLNTHVLIYILTFSVFAAPGMLHNLPPQSTAEQALGATVPREKHELMLATDALELAALLEKNFFLLGTSSRVVHFSVSAIPRQTVNLTGVVSFSIGVDVIFRSLRHSRIEEIDTGINLAPFAATRISNSNRDGLPLRRHQLAGFGNQMRSRSTGVSSAICRSSRRISPMLRCSAN
jgi:hypothetical protein